MVRLLAVEVRHIQTNRGLFRLDTMAHVFERSCAVSQKGALSPIFEGDTPP